MSNYKTIRFNNILYPYVTVSYYDYGKNADINIKVGTDDLLQDLINALNSPDKDLKKKAETFDTDFKRFVPRKLLMKQSETEIIKYLQSHEE